MENESNNPKPEFSSGFHIGDLWPKACSQCGHEKEIASEFVVFTAIKGEKNSLGMRQYSTPYTNIQEHPCRICEACEKKHTTRSMYIPFIAGIIGSVLSFLLVRSLSEEWFAACCVSLLIPIVTIGWWNSSVDKKREQDTADKAARARGAAYIGLTKASLEKIIKSKDSPILE